MKIIVNKSEVDVGSQAFGMLSELLSFLKETHIKKGELIGEVTLDGTVVDPNSGEEFPLSSGQEISVSSLLPVGLADKGLGNLTQHLTELVPMLNEAANNFRTKGEEEANKYFVSCISALTLFSDLINGVGKMLSLDYSQIELEDGNVNEKIKKLQTIFESILDAQNRSDWVLLADILEHELVPESKVWIEKLPEIREKINQAFSK